MTTLKNRGGLKAVILPPHLKETVYKTSPTLQQSPTPTPKIPPIFLIPLLPIYKTKSIILNTIHIQYNK